MTDHDARPERAATHPPASLAELHRLCREDYEQAADRRGGDRPMSTSYDPLYEPEKDGRLFTPPLERAVAQARKVLAEKAQANIHDRDAMIRASYSLHYVLRDLLDALDAERGERR